ncbi:MAG TPA: ABC transporter permease [Chitinophagaceae bacterium]|nr:ABC transporter permease [Chitinophagaceae bacterium]
MFKNYLKISWRNLIQNKVYSFINITGLAIGLAVCMLIVLYVGHEYSYDRFHKNAERIFSVKSKIKLGNDSLYLTQLPYTTPVELQQTEPSVEAFLRVRQEREAIIQNNQEPSLKFAENKFFFADANFFTFFSFKLQRGNKDQVLQNPFSVVISQNIAKKYFGEKDPVGKTIRYNNTYDFIVTGVAGKIPSNSSIEFDFITSISSLYSIAAKDSGQAMEENNFSTYFLLKQPADISTVEQQLLRLGQPKNKAIGRYIGTPLTSLRLSEATDNSNTKYLKIFPFVAALILILALINYMSLSTARSTTRTKEIGVRKVLGADRKMIASQFFVESLLFTSIAFVLGYVLCNLFRPLFFDMMQINIDGSFLLNQYILLSFGLLFIITAILAASYPSILLSAYRPVVVLYGKLSRQGGGISVRKFFTVFQFSISVILIVCGIVINKQIDFFRNTDTGVNRENIVLIPFTSNAAKHYEALKKDIGSISATRQVSTALHPMYKGYDMMGTKATSTGQFVFIPWMLVDQDFISLLGLQWKIKPQDPLFYNNDSAVILNETALQKLGMGNDAVGRKMDDELTVAGVLKDFNYASLQNKIEALCLFVTKDNDSSSLWTKNGGCFFVKINPNVNISRFINEAKTVYGKYDGESPFTYNFLDDAFDAMYKAEDRLLKLLTAFTVFAIFIACLGLFGLAAFMVIQRTKEVGVRKVLGASVAQVTFLLSKDFAKLVLISVVIAAPIAWWIMDKWLTAFAYRTPISWWVFGITACITLSVALITISVQAIKAAVANPVKSLRTE